MTVAGAREVRAKTATRQLQETPRAGRPVPQRPVTAAARRCPPTRPPAWGLRAQEGRDSLPSAMTKRRAASATSARSSPVGTAATPRTPASTTQTAARSLTARVAAPPRRNPKRRPTHAQGSCAASYPAGALPFAALVECREWTCLNTCGGWGSLCDMEESCESCSTCASEDAGPCGSYLDACNNSPSCVAFASCGQECAAVSQTQNEYDNCLLDCQTLEPEGASTFFELDACSISQCPVTCAG